MRKRRYAGSLNEALQTLRSQLAAAQAVQKRIPASTGPVLPVPTPVPAGIASLSNLSAIDEISDNELANLREEIVSAKRETEITAHEWEELQKYLKSAMDAALMLTAIKAEQPLIIGTKRRRTNSFELDEAELEEVKADPEVYTPEAAELAVMEEPRRDSRDSSASEEEEDSEALAITPTASTTANTPTDGASPPPIPSVPTLHSRSSRSAPIALQLGRQVAFKVPQTQVDEWIQCEITKVFPGGQRFEVRDPEPDDLGNPGKTYQCRLKDIIPLPLPGQPIKPLPSGSVVLALYPETTAFYKARVASYSAKRSAYFLRFEGEEDAHKEIEVRENYVLPTRTRR